MEIWQWILKAEKEKSKQFKKKRMSTSNKVLTAAVVAIVLFSIACLYIQYHIQVEVSSTLISLWFTFWTVEMVSLAGIKISKVIKNKNLSSNDTESIVKEEQSEPFEKNEL